MQLFACAIFLLSSVSAVQAAPTPTLSQALAKDLQQYLASRGKPEHISAASLSVGLRGKAATIDVAAGTTTYHGSAGVTPYSLFQIGSNTKAFTAVIILQLQAEHRLALDQTVGKWLPQYPQWKHVTIRQLLNMTSGIPTYDDTQTWQRTYSAAPTAFESPQQLVAFIDPKAPLHKGWYYSNTGYILTEMIIERATHDSYAGEVRKRLISRLGLGETYYEPDMYPLDIQKRMVAGYYANTDPSDAGLAPLLGKDVRPFSVSWMQSAGGIVSSPHDVVHWVRALYQGPLLSSNQRHELMSIVSLKTGRPIAQTSEKDPQGFGLGVGQLTKAPIGTFWFYEGMTLGYRVIYAYVPQSDTVIAIGLNSQPPSKENQSGQLVAAVYQTLKKYRAIP